jgi:MFS family permease
VIRRLAAGMGVATFGVSTLATTVPLYALAQAASPGLIGVLVALPALLPVLVGVRLGERMTGRGAVRWLRRGTLAMAAAPAVLVVAPGLVVLAAAQAWVGLAQLAAALAAQALVAGLGRDATLERDYAVYATALSAGRLVGPVAAGAAIDALGYRAAFGLATAAILLGAATVARVPARLAADTGAATPRPTSRNPWRGAGLLLARPAVRLAVLASGGLFVALAVRQAFVPVALTELGASASAVGGLLSLGAAAAVAVRPFAPWVARRMGGAPRVLVASTVLVAVCLVGLGLAPVPWAFAPLLVGLGAATGVSLPLSLSIVARDVDAEARGRALGVRLVVNRAVQLVAPSVAGLAIALGGIAVGFGAAATTLAAVAAVTARLARRLGP